MVKMPTFLSPLTVAQVVTACTFLDEICRDEEHGHIVEDHIRETVLHSIAIGDHGDPAAALANAALKTKLVRFSRWYA